MDSVEPASALNCDVVSPEACFAVSELTWLEVRLVIWEVVSAPICDADNADNTF